MKIVVESAPAKVHLIRIFGITIIVLPKDCDWKLTGSQEVDKDEIDSKT